MTFLLLLLLFIVIFLLEILLFVTPNLTFEDKGGQGYFTNNVTIDEYSINVCQHNFWNCDNCDKNDSGGYYCSESKFNFYKPFLFPSVQNFYNLYFQINSTNQFNTLEKDVINNYFTLVSKNLNKTITNNIYEEYQQWKSVSEKNQYADYPIIFLPFLPELA